MAATTVLEQLDAQGSPMARAVKLVCLATWGRNHLANTWGPEHGTMMIVPDHRALDKMLRYRQGFCFAEIDWNDRFPVETVPEVLAAIRQARRDPHASLVLVMVASTGEACAVLIPRDRDAMFADETSYRQCVGLMRALQTRDASRDNLSDLMSASLRLCAACGTDLTERRKRKLCAGCRAVYYCDRECQKAHWKTHRRICAAADHARR